MKTARRIAVWVSQSRQIIAHLASFEHVLVDVLNSLLNDNPTPNLDRFVGDKNFNYGEVMHIKEKILTRFESVV